MTPPKPRWSLIGADHEGYHRIGDRNTGFHVLAPTSIAEAVCTALNNAEHASEGYGALLTERDILRHTVRQIRRVMEEAHPDGGAYALTMSHLNRILAPLDDIEAADDPPQDRPDINDEAKPKRWRAWQRLLTQEIFHDEQRVDLRNLARWLNEADFQRPSEDERPDFSDRPWSESMRRPPAEHGTAIHPERAAERVRVEAEEQEGPDWDFIHNLRLRSDSFAIDARDVSGRWRRVDDDYWNDCVIKVRWRIA